MPTLELTDTEFQALAGFLDAGTKALGIRALKDGADILAKMEAAQAATTATAPAPQAEDKV